MVEVDRVKSDLAMQFGEHIIEIDRDVLDTQDPSTTFHVVVIPEERDGFHLVPDPMDWFLLDETAGYLAQYDDRFIHLYVHCAHPELSE